MSDIVNYTYIFLEGIFWGYAFFTLLLLLLFFSIKKKPIDEEVLNWLAALNVSFTLAVIANLINLIFSWISLKSQSVTSYHNPNSVFFVLGRIFTLFKCVVAILFLFKKFRVQWFLSIMAILLINWYKIYYLIEGVYNQWIAYRPNMPGRKWYPLIFFVTLFLSYIFLFVSRQLPYASYWQKWKKELTDV